MLQDQDLISIQEVRTKVEKAHAAFLQYRTYSQERIDSIVEAMSAAAQAHAARLAELAVEETGYGNVKDKIAKNLLTSKWLGEAIRPMKTVGLLREIPDKKIVEFGVPMGVVAAIAPTTNPTSTANFKCMISLKAGNAVVLSPHPHAKRSTAEACDVLHAAAVAAGAPEGIIQCLTAPTTEATQALMRHEKTAVILATGGTGLVRAAYSSGKPAFGVGPGNVPVLVDRSADIAASIERVVAGKSFDYGTVCSSEQSLVAEADLRDQIIEELRKQKAYVCNASQREAVAKILLTPAGTINARCVGQSPTRIAQMAGFEVPPETSILVVEIEGVGKFHPLSAEKLSPVLSLLFVKDWAAALDTCESILKFGGLGHTAGIYATGDARVREFAVRMPAMRVLVNTATPQGSVGITTGLLPSMTLGCGAMAGNVTGDNVGPLHLVNIKRLAYVVRQPEEAFVVPEYIPGAKAPATPRRIAPAAAPAAGSSVDRDAIAAAVDKYLAGRGIATGASKPESAPAPVVAASAASSVSAQVVDRFLATRKTGASSGSSCGCVPACPLNEPAAAAKPAASAIAIADFVCEQDVRAALAGARKIYIGPKTIVTPSARDMAAAHDLLVVAERA
jgi:acyl-CoA reductase-like NAD-dependent aldehyde dehydrogenase